MIAIGNEELKDNKPIGETITCPRCGQEHPIEYGSEVLEDGTKVPSKMLAFYKCGGKRYLGGIGGKEL